MSDRNLISLNCSARVFRGESFDSLYDYCRVLRPPGEETFFPVQSKQKKKKKRGRKSKTLIRKPPKPIFHSNDFTTRALLFLFTRNKTLLPLVNLIIHFPNVYFMGDQLLLLHLSLFTIFYCNNEGQKNSPKKDSFHFKNFI